MSEKHYEILLQATRNAFQTLFQEHPEHYYYCTLIMSECAVPFIAAFSEEALQQAVDANDGNYSAEELKWSYADSPYCGYGYEEYFTELEQVFNGQMDAIDNDDEYDAAIEDWMDMMERVMKQLDEEKLFGEGAAREAMIINAEYMPPEDSNAERAERLNAKAAYQEWYAENFA